MKRRSKARRRRSARQRELLKDAPLFRWMGVAAIAAGTLIGLAGGSATVAWAVATAGGWALGLSLFLPLVARGQRLTWWLVGAGLSAAFVGGLSYLLVPSDATWWLGQLAAIPAVALAMYFGAGSPDARHFDSSSSATHAPPSNHGGGS